MNEVVLVALVLVAVTLVAARVWYGVREIREEVAAWDALIERVRQEKK